MFKLNQGMTFAGIIFFGLLLMGCISNPLAGCHRREANVPTWDVTYFPAPGEAWVRTVKGKTSPNGRLIIWENKFTSTIPVPNELNGDFGMMIFCNAYDDVFGPAIYRLFIQKSMEVIETNSLDEFNKELGNVPDGGTIYRYRTCTVSQDGGLSWYAEKRIQDYCDEHRIEMSTEFPGHIICYCGE